MFCANNFRFCVILLIIPHSVLFDGFKFAADAQQTKSEGDNEVFNKTETNEIPSPNVTTVEVEVKSISDNSEDAVSASIINQQENYSNNTTGNVAESPSKNEIEEGNNSNRKENADINGNGNSTTVSTLDIDEDKPLFSGLDATLSSSERQQSSEEVDKGSYSKLCNPPNLPRGGNRWTQYFYSSFRKCPPTTTTTEPPPHNFMSFDPNRVPNELFQIKPVHTQKVEVLEIRDYQQQQPKRENSQYTPNYKNSVESSRYDLSANEDDEEDKEPVRPSRLDDFARRGPPPKQFRPFDGRTSSSDWGNKNADMILESPPPATEFRSDRRWERMPSSTKASVIKRKASKHGWYFEETTPTLLTWSDGWSWRPTTTEKPGWNQWSHSERPYRPGWNQNEPCCLSGKPYFSPNFGPNGPGWGWGWKYYTTTTEKWPPVESAGERGWRYAPNSWESGESRNTNTYRFRSRSRTQEVVRVVEPEVVPRERTGNPPRRSSLFISATEFPADMDGLFDSWRSGRRGK